MTGMTIAISKGRVAETVQTLWENAGWQYPRMTGSRRLLFPPRDESPGVVVVRGSDVPTLVEAGAVEFGIVGRDILAEQPDHGILEVLDLGVSRCRLVLAGRENRWPEGPVRVATKYPRSTREFFREFQHPVEILPLSGSVELAPSIGLAPYIVDLVATGATLRAHDLVEIRTIYHSTARLVVNAGIWRTQSASRALVARLATSRESTDRAEGGVVVGRRR